MIAALGLRISGFFQRTAPDPFVLAILLTATTFILALTLPASPLGTLDLVDIWADGVWSLLAFGMQMCLVLVTGHAVASSPPVAAMIRRAARVPRTGGQAVVLVAFISAILGVLNWGLGLIAGAVLANQVGSALRNRGVAVHMPLLAAAGYLGMLVWHGGFSGSAPLKMTTASDIAEVFGSQTRVLPLALNETILSPMNLFVTGGLVVLMPLLLGALSPKQGLNLAPQSEIPSPKPALRIHKPFLPRILEDTPIMTLVLVALIGTWVWRFYFPSDLSQSGITRLNLNIVNLSMLLIGLALHGTPSRYVAAIDEAARACGAIILQFPLYAGIMVLMKSSGLTAMLTSSLSASSEGGLVVLTFVSAGVVNLFVPSGGGQWAIQGPIALEAALNAGVAPEQLGKMVMAIAYGDQLTNMLQPFWALPLLAITGVKARDIVGYTAIVMIAAALWITLGLILFS